MTAVLVRPARSADTAELRASRRSTATPRSTATSCSRSPAATSRPALGRQRRRIADPFWPSAELVDLLRTAAHPAEPRPRAPRFALRAVRAA